MSQQIMGAVPSAKTIGNALAMFYLENRSFHVEEIARRLACPEDDARLLAKMLRDRNYLILPFPNTYVNSNLGRTMLAARLAKGMSWDTIGADVLAEAPSWDDNTPLKRS